MRIRKKDSDVYLGKLHLSPIEFLHARYYLAERKVKERIVQTVTQGRRAEENVGSRLNLAQVNIYYLTSAYHEVLKDKYRNDYFDKLSKWIPFRSF
ncbi:MAG TPA: hypothetical protein VFI73_12945 [Candidatus Nitrosopolaris sp.]|nr:hypothetical protein [Candidatus Nitrosopolaris sp.]